MRAITIRDDWPTWKKLLVIAALMAPVMLWLLLTNGSLFLLVAVYGVAVCAFGAFWLGGWRWLLVPLLAMGVELVFAIPATMLDPGGGETPVSVILEAPFWTGLPALVGATFGALMRLLRDATTRIAGSGA